MKKGIRTLFSTLLISALVLTSAGTAFAGTSDAKAAADVSSETQKAVTLQKADFKGLLDGQTAAKKGAATKATGSIPITNITATTAPEDLKVGGVLFSFEDELTPSSSEKGYAQEVKFAAKGTLIMAASVEAAANSGSVEFGLYRDKALTQYVERSYAYPNSGAGSRVIQIPAAGTYYIGMKATISEYSANQEYGVYVAAGYANGGERTLTSGKTVAVGQKNAQTQLFKFKATKTGYLKVQTSDSCYVSLCNSNKKALSGETTSGYAPTYGVKKGSTYWIKVRTYSNSDGVYNLRATNTAVSEKSGSSKAKAVTIKKGKTSKGTVLAGENKADWYKFKLTGKKAVKVIMKGETNDNLKISIYQGSRNVKNSSFYYNSKSLTIKSIGKWPKGTYYVKIYRGNSKSSGHYSVTWK